MILIAKEGLLLKDILLGIRRCMNMSELKRYKKIRIREINWIEYSVFLFYIGMIIIGILLFFGTFFWLILTVLNGLGLVSSFYNGIMWGVYLSLVVSFLWNLITEETSKMIPIIFKYYCIRAKECD